MSSKLKENLSWSLYLCKDVGFSQCQENSERNWKFWFVDLPGWANQPLLPPISLSLVSIGRRRQQTVARRVVVEYTAIAPWKDCRSSTWAIVLSLFIFIRTEGALRLRLRPPIDEQLRSKRGEGWGREGGGAVSSRSFDLLTSIISDLKRSVNLRWLFDPVLHSSLDDLVEWG